MQVHRIIIELDVDATVENNFGEISAQQIEEQVSRHGRYASRKRGRGFAQQSPVCDTYLIYKRTKDADICTV